MNVANMHASRTNAYCQHYRRSQLLAPSSLTVHHTISQCIPISIAVSAPKGLVVPVLRDVDAMSFAGVEGTIAAFGKKAREGTLGIDEMSGGTFTISNGGATGSLVCCGCS